MKRQPSQIVLIHPPVVKPSEPPAGIARLAGALRSHGIGCALIDANIEGLHALLDADTAAHDTWTRRAVRHLANHLSMLRSPDGYQNRDRYIRAVADINRVLQAAGKAEQIRVSLGDYRDELWSPVRSEALRQSTQEPERNPFCTYFRTRLIPRVAETGAAYVGISINYLSQALCAFALIGTLKAALPEVKVVVGGGLITSWAKQKADLAGLGDLVDRFVIGAGECRLLELFGVQARPQPFLPDYHDLVSTRYLSPGFVLPFSASDGCWWRRCGFCPERAERRPFRPLPRSAAVQQLQHLAALHRPAMIHLLDNAVSPALLKSLVQSPPGAPWYGFVRIGAPLDDPAFCRRLAAAGCVMLKIGLESGNQRVLDQLHKGVSLSMAARVLENLHRAGILTYVYLLFGTPAEDAAAARDTLRYVAEHAASIDFLNLAVFNLPVQSPDARGLSLSPFYEGDLALYCDFEHPSGWGRAAVRRFLDGTFKKHPAIQPIIQRDPPLFTSNHAAFFPGATPSFSREND